MDMGEEWDFSKRGINYDADQLRRRQAANRGRPTTKAEVEQLVAEGKLEFMAAGKYRLTVDISELPVAITPKGIDHKLDGAVILDTILLFEFADEG